MKNWNNLADYRTFRKKRETDHSWTAETWAGNDHFADWAAALLLGRDDKQEKNGYLNPGDEKTPKLIDSLIQNMPLFQ